MNMIRKTILAALALTIAGWGLAGPATAQPPERTYSTLITRTGIPARMLVTLIPRTGEDRRLVTLIPRGRTDRTLVTLIPRS